MLLTVFCLVCCMVGEAQQMSYPALNDSVFLSNTEYQQGNKYQRDAILFVDMLVNTHPYYIQKERRDSLMAVQPILLNACKECTSDSLFTQLLYGVLGKLHDRHTDVIDSTTFARMIQQKQQMETSTAMEKSDNIMAYGGDLFHYQIFPEQSICYLQFNSCQDARTMRNDSQPRWDLMLNEMFGRLETEHIQTLVVDAQYNGGGNSMLCDELLLHLRPFSDLKNFQTFIRFSDLMASFNPRIAIAKKAWEDDGHTDELYLLPSGQPGKNFVQPPIYEGKVVFVQGQRTYSSAGILMTLARDNHIGEIIGQPSSYPPSHYGEVLPFSLPNTGMLGSVCTKYFARPDTTCVNDEVLVPDVVLDLNDKVAAWQFIVGRYGKTK